MKARASQHEELLLKLFCHWLGEKEGTFIRRAVALRIKFILTKGLTKSYSKEVFDSYEPIFEQFGRRMGDTLRTYIDEHGIPPKYHEQIYAQAEEILMKQIESSLDRTFEKSVSPNLEKILHQIDKQLLVPFLENKKPGPKSKKWKKGKGRKSSQIENSHEVPKWTLPEGKYVN